MNPQDTDTQKKDMNAKAIAELIDRLPVMIVQGSPGIAITDLTEDSRTAAAGCLFIARPGEKNDGRRFVADAIKAGATAVLAEQKLDVPAHVVMLVSDDVAGCSAIMAERFFDSPSRRLKLIGITGTNGKTTTAYLVQQLLNRANIRCGLIGTVQVDDGVRREVANLTTPPAIELSRVMHRMIRNGCRACVMEASSHALHQRRTHGLRFQVGVFTNLTGDHLDYHKTMDEYFAAKAILFENLPDAREGGVAIVNGDDPHSDEMLRRTKARALRCSEHDERADCFARVQRQTISHTASRIAGPWGAFDVNLPLIGAHNVMNALQAMAVAHAFGVSGAALHEMIETIKAPPGRLEPVTNIEHPFAVLVDYAHTDDALENVLRALRPVMPKHGKLRVVFGCGGDRDRTKRPRMARSACKFADDVIITSDNPRTEDPQAIINEIRAGVPSHRLDSTHCDVDRASAINAAIDRAADGDIILIAGKGHEDYQIIGTAKRPFDDRLIASDALRARFMHLQPMTDRAIMGAGR